MIECDLENRLRSEKPTAAALQTASLGQVAQITIALAHDVRGPLQSLVGYAYLLGTENTGPLNEQQRRFLEHLRTGAQQLLDVIQVWQEQLSDVIQSQGNPQ